MKETNKYQLVVIGASFGGIDAVSKILGKMDRKFDIPVVIVMHQAKNINSDLIYVFKNKALAEIKEPLDKEKINKCRVYLAPADYHLLIEKDRTFSYSYSERINFARPSIDLLFETAAETYGENLVSVLLTGANSDGSNGILKTSLYGGLTIVQNPDEAEARSMPESAMKICKVDHVLTLNQISEKLNSFCYE